MNPRRKFPAGGPLSKHKACEKCYVAKVMSPTVSGSFFILFVSAAEEVPSILDLISHKR